MRPSDGGVGQRRPSPQIRPRHVKHPPAAHLLLLLDPRARCPAAAAGRRWCPRATADSAPAAEGDRRARRSTGAGHSEHRPPRRCWRASGDSAQITTPPKLSASACALLHDMAGGCRSARTPGYQMAHLPCGGTRSGGTRKPATARGGGPLGCVAQPASQKTSEARTDITWQPDAAPRAPARPRYRSKPNPPSAPPVHALVHMTLLARPHAELPDIARPVVYIVSVGYRF